MIKHVKRYDLPCLSINERGLEVNHEQTKATPTNEPQPGINPNLAKA